MSVELSSKASCDEFLDYPEQHHEMLMQFESRVFHVSDLLLIQTEAPRLPISCSR